MKTNNKLVRHKQQRIKNVTKNCDSYDFLQFADQSKHVNNRRKLIARRLPGTSVSPDRNIIDVSRPGDE